MTFNDRWNSEWKSCQWLPGQGQVHFRSANIIKLSLESFLNVLPISCAGPSRTTSRRPAKKSAPMKLNPSEEANQQIQRFPSLASLVYIQDLPVVYPTKTTTTTTTTTSRRPPTASLKRAPTTPYRKSTSTQKPRTTKRVKNLVSDYSCPKPEMVPFRWFPLPCDSHKQCTKSMGKNYRCCEINSNSFKTCTKGIVKQIPEQKHTRRIRGNILHKHNDWPLPFPALFGVPVKCPKVPLAELFWNVQACETDNDCWPRVCCPDGRKKFCRSPNPEFKDAKTPFARQLMQRKDLPENNKKSPSWYPCHSQRSNRRPASSSAQHLLHSMSIQCPVTQPWNVSRISVVRKVQKDIVGHLNDLYSRWWPTLCHRHSLAIS